MARRQQIVDATGLELDTRYLDDVDWEVVIDEETLDKEDEKSRKFQEVFALRDTVMGLNEFIIGVWIPEILEKYGNPNGMDKHAKEKVRNCMIGAGMSPEMQRHWTEEAWDHLSQLGTFEQWTRFVWSQQWERLESIDGKVQRGEVVEI